jgi:hypothetical protein
VIQTRHAWADDAEHFIGDHAGPFGDVVSVDLLVTLASDDDGLSRFFNLSEPIHPVMNEGSLVSLAEGDWLTNSPSLALFHCSRFTSHPARSARPAFFIAESLKAAICHLDRAQRSKFRATQLASLRCL